MTLSRKDLEFNQNALFALADEIKAENRDRDAQLRSLGASVRQLIALVENQADEIDALKSDLETANQAVQTQRRLVAELEGRTLPTLLSTTVGFDDIKVPEPA